MKLKEAFEIWDTTDVEQFESVGSGGEDNSSKAMDAISRIIEHARAMRLRPISSAPKDGSYMLLFGDSGYLTTPLRCEVGRWDARYRPHHPWQTHSNDAFEDGGEPPLYWMPLPEINQ